MDESLLPIVVHLAIALLGATTTYLLQSKGVFNKVQSSALTTLIFASMVYFLKNWLPLNLNGSVLMSIFWGASFIAMSSPKVVNWSIIIIAPLVFVLTFEVAHHCYPTFGGKLGIIAAISSLVALAVNWLFSRALIPILKRIARDKK